MTVLRGGDIDRYVAAPGGRHGLVLLYGADAGLVTERGAAIAMRSVPDPENPLAIVRLDGDELASDVMRLTDEANAIGLFGARRAIRVRVGSRNLAPALEPLIRTPPLDSVVVLEAGDLRRTSPLVALCEKSANAIVLPCYADALDDIERLLDKQLQSSSLSIDQDARELLLSLLGADRLTTRNEISKLVAYMGDAGRICLADVEAIIGDATAAAIDDAVDGAFSGDVAAMLGAVAKLAAEVGRPDALIAASLGRAALLMQGVAQHEAGDSAIAVSRRLIRHFKRQPGFAKQLSLWPTRRLRDALRTLGEASLAGRQSPELAWRVIERSLMRIALMARRR
ncbi:MAG: DNA polymerase III subunit delta [Beijerinckiaceae bacterium]